MQGGAYSAAFAAWKTASHVASRRIRVFKFLVRISVPAVLATMTAWQRLQRNFPAMPARPFRTTYSNWW